MEVQEPTPAKKWQPLTSRQRRVVGVLVEKAKTTAEQYPLSLNALTTGCNQKSNRSPQMNFSADDAEQILDELREIGAVVEVQSSSRVAKYKHCMYDWLDVDKLELAVVAELLLRGEQTVGDLRGRASRMEPISDLNVLQPVLDSLVAKGLVVELTAAGRGQLVTHALYTERELAAIRERVGTGQVSSRPAPAASSAPAGVTAQMFQDLQQQVADLRGQLDELRSQVQTLDSIG